MSNFIPIARLHDVLQLDVETGVLSWKIATGRRNKIGMVAGTIRQGEKSGYRAIGVDGQYFRAHRLVFAMVHGRWPKFVDHINGIRDDNRPENLREATLSQNGGNQRLSRRNTTGFKGVCFDSNAGKFRASICHESRAIHLGFFADASDAAAAYVAAANKLFGEFARAA